jgi:integration host factor subunit beta
MTRSELVTAVAASAPHLSVRQVEKIVDVVFNSILDALKDGNRVEIRGFGNFSITKRAPKKARNPKTGEVVSVPAKSVAHFKVGKKLYDMLNTKK